MTTTAYCKSFSLSAKWVATPPIYFMLENLFLEILSLVALMWENYAIIFPVA
jgi:hypothetical protein